MTAERQGASRLLHLSGYDLGGFRVIDLSRECDISTQSVLGDGLADALADSCHVIVDMSHVHFRDVASALLILAAFSGSSRRLAVAGVDPTTGRLLALLDPTGEMPRYRSVDAAAGYLSGLP